MNRIHAFAAVLGALLFSPLASAQTDGSVTLSAKISDTGSGPKHWTVVWVTDATTGAFMRTIRRQGPTYRTHWNNHCPSWYAAVAANVTNYTVATDGFTGATAGNYTAPNSPFTQTWDCKDANGATIPDGTYKIWIQYAEDTSSAGPVTTGGLLWTKGASADTVNPPNQGTNFTNMSIVWTPVQPPGPEIAVEQPVGTNIADGGLKNFGSVVVGSSVDLTFTIKNPGSADLTDLSITEDGGNSDEFTITSTPVAPLAAAGSTTFTVNFAPKATGARTASIHIASNDGNENPFDITLTGTGASPDMPEITIEQPAGNNIIYGDQKKFGSVLVGSNKSLTFTIRNTGLGVLTGVAITRDGANPGEFTLTTAPLGTVAPAGNTTFTIKFAPAGAGERSAIIHIANNDSDESPFDILLSGTAVLPVPEIAIEQPAGSGLVDGKAKKSFGTVKVGKTGTAKTFTIKNTGLATLTGLSITKNGAQKGDFTLTAPAKTSLAPGTSTTFKVTFKPKAKGTRNAAIHIKSNDSNENPFDISLTGLGAK